MSQLHKLHMQKKFYSSHWFLKDQIFSSFPIVNINANYAEINRIVYLEVKFQQVPRVHFFSEIFTILLLNSHNLDSAKKNKKYFLR